MDMNDFTSFLHNPWKYPTKKEEVAMTIKKRKERFVMGYSCYDDLNDLLLKYFGNQKSLYNFGLVKHYKMLQMEVEEKNLIGLILLGTNTDKDKNINTYVTKNESIIELTITSITQRLITEYIKKENVEKLCMLTPNFQEYYNIAQ